MFGETVTIIRPTFEEDRYGNQVPLWTNATEIPVREAAYDPGTMAEDDSRRTAVIARPTVFLPTGTDVRPTDRVRVRGIDYDAIGHPSDWRNPFTGRRPGMTLGLKRVDG